MTHSEKTVGACDAGEVLNVTQSVGSGMSFKKDTLPVSIDMQVYSAEQM